MNSRNQRRRQRTREQILNAVQSVLLSEGYEGTSAEGIAEFADLGRSTFYNHFTSKKEAILATVIERYERYGEQAYIPPEEIEDRALTVAHACRRVFKSIVNDPLTAALIDHPQLLVKAAAQSQESFVVREFEAGIDQGRFFLYFSLETLVNTIGWAFIGMLTMSLKEGDVETCCDNWCRILLHNLGVERSEIENLIKQSRELDKEKKIKS